MTEQRTGDGWWVTSFIIGVVALIAGVIGIALAAGDDEARSAAAPAGGSGGETEFDVTLADISVSPRSIDVPAGETVTLHVTNTGVMDHDIKVNGETGTKMLKPGESETIVIGPFTAGTSAWCTVPGHRAAGMEMTINVTGDAALGGTDHGGTSTGGGTSSDGSAVIDSAVAPADDWEARDPVLPAAPTGTVHEISLDATEELIEVAPGVTQMMWTFNGQVPGPIIRGKLGDTFRVTLTNKGVLGHSIDFHASKVAWNDEMRTLQPGESLVYEFTATNAGAYMYHCGTAPALHHIGNGMYGAIIIDPPDLPEVEEEFVFVQSELYLGPEGAEGDLTKMLNDDWDAVVFNGYFNQYFHRPIHVEANKTYRVWVINDGPSENSSFHIVGTIFDTMYKEGAYTLQPDEMQGGAQALDLQPAQGGFVEFDFAEDGLYLFVTHKFSNVGKGALGVFAVGDADTSAIGGH